MKTRRQHEIHLDANLDTDVAWARRKDTIGGTLKMFRVVLDAVRRHAEWVEAHYAISAAQLWALWELIQAPGMRAVDLARALVIPRPAAESLLAGLEGRGLVMRRPGQESAGPELFFASFDGQRIAEASPQYAQGVLKSALGQLPEAALGELTRSLSALVAHLPFREESAALQPMAELLRPEGERLVPAKTGTSPQ